MSTTIKEGKVTSKEIRVPERAKIRKEYLVVKDPELKPTMFRFKYNEGWVIEDTKEYHKLLRRNGLDLDHKQGKYNDKYALTEALHRLKLKRKQERKAIKADNENFTIDSENEIDEELNLTKPLELVAGKTIDQVIYDEIKPRYVKVLRRKPNYKIVYGNRRFCQNETLPTRRLERLAMKGVDINKLKKDNLEEYYDQFVRCRDIGRYEFEGRFYCANHYKDKKYGRIKPEDQLDW